MIKAEGFDKHDYVDTYVYTYTISYLNDYTFHLNM